MLFLLPIYSTYIIYSHYRYYSYYDPYISCMSIGYYFSSKTTCFTIEKVTFTH